MTLRWIERACLAVGAALLSLVAISYFDGTTASRAALDAFAARADAAAGENLVDEPGATPDQADWSEQRKTAYMESLGRDIGVPEAVLAIADLSLEVPVFGSTKRVALNRGVGVVEGTARPGEDGNVAIAGHRDGFFRPLEDLQVGASIDLRTLQGVRRYRVSEILIVDPLDGSVLAPTAEPTLTLITCYPFYYVGYAPDRYIVRAILEPGIVEKELRTGAEQ